MTGFSKLPPPPPCFTLVETTSVLFGVIRISLKDRSMASISRPQNGLILLIRKRRSKAKLMSLKAAVPFAEIAGHNSESAAFLSNRASGAPNTEGSLCLSSLPVSCDSCPEKVDALAKGFFSDFITLSLSVRL